MGRLFWKFFFIFWLAQLLTAGGIAAAVWLEYSEKAHWSSTLPGAPPPPFCDAASPIGPPQLPQHFSPRAPIPVAPIVSGSLVSLLFAALLAWYFAKPIRCLREAFEAVASGNLSTRIGPSMGYRRDELADLGSGFDRMAQQLQNLLDTQRRLLHDASHELCSPLARLQAAADLMRQQPERSNEFLERIQRDTARMNQLVGELLTLARLDSGIAGTLEEDVDLREIIADAADNARFEAEPKHCVINTTTGERIILRSNRELLSRALENVVRNAIRYSPQNGQIDIDAQYLQGSLQLTVADNGPGVPHGDLDAIFEPFFRSGNRSPAGFGLGLAITRRVVELHNGSISAVNRPEGGLTVTLRLPATEPLADQSFVGTI